ncbi:MAG: VOC family protein [Phycisphaerales bacterium]|nr:hypothetical protein [Planctomycetota bacterium]
MYGDNPDRLAVFYQRVLGWETERMPGVAYWRARVPSEAAQPLVSGGIAYRAVPGFNGWLMYAQVASVDHTAALITELGGAVVRPKTAVPRTAWVTIVSDPEKNIFGIWEPDPNAFPMPEPD